MAIVVLLARGLLWLQTLIYLLGSVSLLSMPQSKAMFERPFMVFVVGWVVFSGLLGLGAGIVWRSKPDWARRLAIGSAAASLLIIPVGTLLGF